MEFCHSSKPLEYACPKSLFFAPNFLLAYVKSPCLSFRPNTHRAAFERRCEVRGIFRWYVNVLPCEHFAAAHQSKTTFGLLLSKR